MGLEVAVERRTERFIIIKKRRRKEREDEAGPMA
jgi:hypothetical protein